MDSGKYFEFFGGGAVGSGCVIIVSQTPDFGSFFVKKKDE